MPTTDAADRTDAARSAGLRYVSDAQPGITRRRAGRSFSYWLPTGERLTDPVRLQWIRALAVPPAWTDVWISPTPNGHILATGRDARGRKQHRYHPRWREVRDETKYQRLIEFGEVLPAIRERVDADLGRPGLPRQKVIAAVVRLLELTFIRIGNEEYARLNRSFGLTTLRNRHVIVDGTSIRFRFRGKSGKVHEAPRSAARPRSPGRPGHAGPGTFEHIDADGTIQTIESDDVNAYLRETSGSDFTAKTSDLGRHRARFRALCCSRSACETPRGQGNVVGAIKAVAERLRNTPAVCRSSYVHPGYRRTPEGSLGDRASTRHPKRVDPLIPRPRRLSWRIAPRQRAVSNRTAPGT